MYRVISFKPFLVADVDLELDLKYIFMIFIALIKQKEAEQVRMPYHFSIASGKTNDQVVGQLQ